VSPYPSRWLTTFLLTFFASCGGTEPPEPTNFPVPSIVWLSRDAGSTAGGASLRISGSKLVTGAIAMFGEAPATGVAEGDSVLVVTVPAHATGKVDIRVIQGEHADTLLQAFEYLPAPTTTFFNSDFEGGTIAPFFADGPTVSISTDFAKSGTHSVLGTRASTGNAGLAFKFTSPLNPPAAEANGLYMRWYMYVPTTTIDNVQGSKGQIKMTLSRKFAGSGQPGWLMCGVGSAFTGRLFTCRIDNFIQHFANGETSLALGDGKWVEFETWYKRNNGAGTARMWVNGKLIFEVTHAELGDDTAEQTWARFGLVYTEVPTGEVRVYIDKVTGANGFIDP
jgi:hypothetical protein